MKDRHIHIAADDDLLKSIYRRVDAELTIDKNRFQATVWTKFAFYFLVTSITYLGLYKIDNSIAFVVCYILYGFSILLFAFNFAHDFSHGTIFKNHRWNNLGFIFIYALNGAHAEAWKKRHIESHHFAPNVESYDSDLEISEWIRVIPTSRYIWYHRFQHLYAPVAYTIYSLYWVFIKDFYIFFKDAAKGYHYQFSFIAQKLFYATYLVFLPLVYSGQHWYVVVMGFILMHLTQSLFLLFTFFITHHVEGVEYPTIDKNGFINASWVMNQIRSSNDIHPFSNLANFIFGGFNNHIAHHLFPHIHSVHYPSLNKILYRALLEHGINPNQTTYFGGVSSHLRLLKKMGTKAGDNSVKAYAGSF